MPRPFLAVLLAAPFLLAAGCPGSDSATGANCVPQATLSPGTIVNGATGPGNCRIPDGSAGQSYPLTIPSQSNVAVKVVPTGFPAHVAVYTATDKLVGESNNGVVPAFLPTGSYKVFVSSNTNADGPFTLSLLPTALNNCAYPGGYTVRGAQITGKVESADCFDATSYDKYEFKLDAGTAFSVSVNSDQPIGIWIFGTTGPIGNTVLNAAGSWTWSGTAAATGYYGVRVESYNKTVFPATYTITLN